MYTYVFQTFKLAYGFSQYHTFNIFITAIFLKAIFIFHVNVNFVLFIFTL